MTHTAEYFRARRRAQGIPDVAYPDGLEAAGMAKARVVGQLGCRLTPFVAESECSLPKFVPY
jgi:hypothetical protein